MIVGTQVYDEDQMPQISKSIVSEIWAEAWKAMSCFAPFNSAHEAYAVLLEEVDELWDEVKLNQSKRDPAKMRKEAVQVGAMALRFIMDICDGGRVRR